MRKDEFVTVAEARNIWDSIFDLRDDVERLNDLVRGLSKTMRQLKKEGYEEDV